MELVQLIESPLAVSDHTSVPASLVLPIPMCQRALLAGLAERDFPMLQLLEAPSLTKRKLAMWALLALWTM